MNKLTAAYIAGFVDGEGCIGVNRVKAKTVKSNGGYTYKVRLRVSNTNKEIIEWLYKSFGGSFYVSRRENNLNKNHKVAYDWAIADQKAKIFLEKIKPYLKIKKEQAEIAIKVAKLKDRQRSGQIVKGFQGVKGKKKSDWELLHELYEHIKRLNKRGVVVQSERLSGVTPQGDTTVHI